MANGSLGLIRLLLAATVIVILIIAFLILALGFSENQSFFRFIFPQAAVRQMPVYRGEIISLLKNTSVVGYIAIQDLTKMSDIIRSRTYEAFFPLIVTAVIYFILAFIISVVLNFVLKAIDPRAKKKDQKGGSRS